MAVFRRLLTRAHLRCNLADYLRRLSSAHTNELSLSLSRSGLNPQTNRQPQRAGSRTRPCVPSDGHAIAIASQLIWVSGARWLPLAIHLRDVPETAPSGRACLFKRDKFSMSAKGET